MSRISFNLGNMSRLAVGIVAGLIFGTVDVALMLPMSFPDKRTALVAAFLSRFGIGLVIPIVNLPTWPGWLVGVIFGVLLSLPDAVVTKAYVPILIGGVVGGLIIGGLTRGWGIRVYQVRQVYYYRCSACLGRASSILDEMLWPHGVLTLLLPDASQRI
jgi:hypothetical protein